MVSVNPVSSSNTLNFKDIQAMSFAPSQKIQNQNQDEFINKQPSSSTSNKKKWIVGLVSAAVVATSAVLIFRKPKGIYDKTLKQYLSFDDISKMITDFDSQVLTLHGFDVKKNPALLKDVANSGIIKTYEKETGVPLDIFTAMKYQAIIKKLPQSKAEFFNGFLSLAEYYRGANPYKFKSNYDAGVFYDYASACITSKEEELLLSGSKRMLID